MIRPSHLRLVVTCALSLLVGCTGPAASEESKKGSDAAKPPETAEAAVACIANARIAAADATLKDSPTDLEASGCSLDTSTPIVTRPGTGTPD